MDKQYVSAYLFKPGEMETLLADISVERNALSPVSAVSASAALTDEKLKLRDSADFLAAASILLSPQIRVSAVKGGGSLEIEHFDLLGRIDGKDAKWAALLNNDNKTAVLLFNNTRAFIEWFSDTFAVRTDIPMNNFLASAMTLDEWIVLAHTIDAFRRVYMESMLLYRPGREYYVSAEDFIASLNVSLESGDIRWLLPAFFAVTPGFSGIKPVLSTEVIAAAETYGLVRRGRNPETNADIFTFTETGMTLGLEFATSWMYGVGFEAKVSGDDGKKCAPACFLAPTSLGNHLFLAANTETGELTVTHQALKHTELDDALDAWFDKVVDYTIGIMGRKQAAAPIPANTEETAEQSGIELITQVPQAIFTSGPEVAQPVQAPQSPQPPAARFCMKCGNSIAPGGRFCSKCGNKVV